MSAKSAKKRRSKRLRSHSSQNPIKRPKTTIPNEILKNCSNLNSGDLCGDALQNLSNLEKQRSRLQPKPQSDDTGQDEVTRGRKARASSRTNHQAIRGRSSLKGDGKEIEEKKEKNNRRKTGKKIEQKVNRNFIENTRVDNIDQKDTIAIQEDLQASNIVDGRTMNAINSESNNKEHHQLNRSESMDPKTSNKNTFDKREEDKEHLMKVCVHP